RRRRSDLVRAAEAVSEAVLSNAARQRVHPGLGGLPRSVSLAARRPAGLRALVRGHRLGAAVSPLRAGRPPGAAARRPRPRRSHAGFGPHSLARGLPTTDRSTALEPSVHLA